MPIRRSLVGIALALTVLPLSALAFEIPDNDNYVTQTSPFLTTEQEADIEARLLAYDRETSNQIAILLTETTGGEDIIETAVDVGRTWGVGTAEHSNGVVVLIALEDREAAIQVGYGLEGALPDIVVSGILNEDLIPHMRDASYYEGLLATIDAIEKHVGGEYTAERYEAASESPSISFLFFFLFIGVQMFAAWFSRSKSWWAGGVVGGGAGLLLSLLWNWWFSIPLLVVIGLLFDYVVSKNPRIGRGRGGRGPWIGGGGFGGRGGSGGGAGGFGGGSFGGGGASGKW